MRVLLVCHHDWAGAVYALMDAVNKHTEHDARAITLEPTWMDYPHDVLDPNWVDLWRLLNWADVLNLYDNTAVMLPEAMLDKPVVRSYLGSEYRSNWKNFNQQDNARGWPQTCTTIDLSLHGPTWLGMPMGMVDRPEPGESFTVCHAPTNRGGKGTKLVIEALADMEGVELDIIEHLPHRQCMERKAKAHLLIDQVGPRALGYGRNALEAWALGMPVISDAPDDVLKILRRRALGLPFYRAGTARQIRLAIEDLHRDSVYANWRDRGRRHICKWHDPAAVARRFVEICQMACSPRTHDNVALPKVFSHPRSGTAFLGATLKKCFYRDVDTTSDGGPAGHWSNRVNIPGLPYGKLIGNHAFWHGHKGIYIYRDGRDVAVSMWRAKMMQGKEDHGLPFADFLRKPLDWRATPAHKNDDGVTIAKHWQEHLDSWQGQKKVLMVRYEDLILQPAETLKAIGDYIEIAPYSLEPQETPVGIDPREGCVGTWREYFTEADLEFFYTQVPADYWGFYDFNYHPQEYWQWRGNNYQETECPDELDSLNDWFKSLKAERILEVGSGWGRIYLRWESLNLGGTYTMCDFAQSMLDGCQQATGVRPDEWDGKRLPYPDGAFDLGVSFSVFLHVPPADVKAMLVEHARVCSRLFVATLDNYDDQLSEHCFVHDYEPMFTDLELEVIEKRQFGDRAHWLLRKTDGVD